MTWETHIHMNLAHIMHKFHMYLRWENLQKIFDKFNFPSHPAHIVQSDCNPTNKDLVDFILFK